MFNYRLAFSLFLIVGCNPTSPDDPGDDVTDADGDGVEAAADCDDADATLGATAEDADCDGVLTADDCDDADATSWGLCYCRRCGLRWRLDSC